ncbi:GNAT family N-acetyltransferase [Rhizobacter sp. AJA081-3]|jgi:GNAT superfamily N-acetyltransferase|uniref:GNAT family N-acetyltransferase n=1 Tax=Rhizobacter sp. AJA081-3 TaxID=2753607 RepID=UPI001AE0D395|nr:GNAT family N-acetyltransferase [Rhizobacter sp. AJA081-3]QTN21988.1 GNAT family N-acetyltransferase [Rhizobacter sp. AJA081-3]
MGFPDDPRQDSLPSSASQERSATASPEVDSSSKWTWVPIRSLGPRHRDRIAAHLISLDAADRYLRFGYPANDAQIARYVDMLDFDQDEVFGIFNRRLDLIAMAHLAHPATPTESSRGTMAEFGVTVLKKARGRGFGARLFEHSVLHARNRGVQTLFIHALSENTAMLKIARNAGATVERDGSESDAWLRLPPDTFASHVEEVMGQQAAEFDYQIKRHVTTVQRIIETISEVKAHISDSRHIAGE